VAAHTVKDTSLDLVITADAEDLTVQPIKLHDVGSQVPDVRPAVVHYEQRSAAHIQALVGVRPGGVGD